MGKYKLGEYEFDTYEELLAAEEDTKKIDVITSNMDVTDLEVALSIYEKIRNNEIVFHSSVGSGFFMYLSDIVVAGARNLVEEEKEKEERSQKKRRKSFIYRGIGIVLIACAAGIFSYIYRNEMAERRSMEEVARVRQIQNLTGSGISDEAYSENVVEDNTALLNQLREQREQDSVAESTQNAESGRETVKKKLKILPEYQTLYAENTDFIGWISIEGTGIDYPVMQTEEEAGQFYLDHSFYKSSDKNGTLFLDVRNDFIDRDTNLIIYGHNMKSGVMFGGLKRYLEDDYLKSHRTITFDTIYEKDTYEVIGAGLSEVSYEDEYTFRYYNFLNAGSKDEWEAFKANMKQLLSSDLSLFDVEPGDELLTLSTCSSYREQGRMFVIAKKK